ncbi:MAG: GGDEF domain-containing protein [Clostridiales bacterium]|nr:GGDEF domain-containing protein [Clostridiales bacterium]
MKQSDGNRRIVAVCASWEDVENLNLILSQLIEVTEQRNYLPMCVAFDRSGVESRGEESIREFMAAFDIPNLAGFLLLGEMIRSDEINQSIIRLAQRRKLPVFMLERAYKGCINLAFSYLDGFEKVVRHMVEDHRCRDIVMVAGIRGNSFSEDRIRLCREILEENGGSLPEDKVIYGEYWDEPTYRALNGYFAAGGNMPEAFLCANDAMAIAVSIYLSERNIRVPEQVRVAGFDGILQGESHVPAITTARPGFAYMYGRMLDRMDSWQEENTGRTETWPVPFDFIRRESCGCVQGNSFLSTKKSGELKIDNLMYTRHIRAMGNFIRKTLSMNSLDRLSKQLSALFSGWPNPFYFAAVLNEKDKGQARSVMHSRHGLFLPGTVYRWKESPVTDEATVRSDPSIRILMVQLLQNEEETMGYLVSGLQAWSMREQERFEEEALFLSAAFNAVIGNRRLAEANNAILRMAEHDYLTGLYNRRGFLRELDRRIRLPESRGKTLTLYAMDMDGLKSINDVFGHYEGDYAIQCLAKALEQVTGDKGICARYGGDEFAFAILGDSSAIPDTEEIRNRIEAAAREACGPKDYRIRASIGAASCPVSDPLPLDPILAESDRALYADKRVRKAGKDGRDSQTPSRP